VKREIRSIGSTKYCIQIASHIICSVYDSLNGGYQDPKIQCFLTLRMISIVF
jgi:hypothetical protein